MRNLESSLQENYDKYSNRQIGLIRGSLEKSAEGLRQIDSNDEEIIRAYESSTEGSKIRNALESHYQEAVKTRLEEVAGGVVVVVPGEKVDVYVSVGTDEKKYSPLEKSLCGAVLTALGEHQKVVKEDEAGSILKLSLSGDYNKIVASLEGCIPEGFEKAGVGYKVVRFPGVEQYQEPIEEKTKKIRKRRNAANDKPSDPIPVGWLTLRETQALTGSNYSSFLMGKKVFDYQKGPVETKKEGKARLVNKSSLEEYLNDKHGPAKIFTMGEAAEYMKKSAQESLPKLPQRDYQDFLRRKVSTGELITMQDDSGNRVLSERELARVLVPYMAKHSLRQWGSTSISYQDLAGFLHTNTKSVCSMTSSGKLELQKRNGNIDVRSALSFLRKNHYVGRKWMINQRKNSRKTTNESE